MGGTLVFEASLAVIRYTLEKREKISQLTPNANRILREEREREAKGRNRS